MRRGPIVPQSRSPGAPDARRSSGDGASGSPVGARLRAREGADLPGLVHRHALSGGGGCSDGSGLGTGGPRRSGRAPPALRRRPRIPRGDRGRSPRGPPRAGRHRPPGRACPGGVPPDHRRDGVDRVGQRRGPAPRPPRPTRPHARDLAWCRRAHGRGGGRWSAEPRDRGRWHWHLRRWSGSPDGPRRHLAASRGAVPRWWRAGRPDLAGPRPGHAGRGGDHAGGGHRRRRAPARRARGSPRLRAPEGGHPGAGRAGSRRR